MRVRSSHGPADGGTVARAKKQLQGKSGLVFDRRAEHPDCDWSCIPADVVTGYDQSHFSDTDALRRGHGPNHGPDRHGRFQCTVDAVHQRRCGNLERGQHGERAGTDG
jgi:hypothetical protein